MAQPRVTVFRPFPLAYVENSLSIFGSFATGCRDIGRRLTSLIRTVPPTAGLVPFHVLPWPMRRPSSARGTYQRTSTTAPRRGGSIVGRQLTSLPLVKPYAVALPRPLRSHSCE